jgi:protein-S-isoprenylcysteine O-methyltransferase Ste14
METTVVNIIALILFLTVYVGYIVKLLILTRKHIKVDVLGKGNKPKGRAAVEVMLKCVTYVGTVVQFYSIITGNKTIWRLPSTPIMQAAGLILMLLGAASYIAAIITMKTNWRAGFAEGQNTELVTDGVYKYSRNPAFVGFDLFNFGCAMAFPNALTIVFALLSAVLFHIQIKGEEDFLESAFGGAYQSYKADTMRYIGRRK